MTPKKDAFQIIHLLKRQHQIGRQRLPDACFDLINKERVIRNQSAEVVTS